MLARCPVHIHNHFSYPNILSLLFRHRIFRSQPVRTKFILSRPFTVRFPSTLTERDSCRIGIVGYMLHSFSHSIIFFSLVRIHFTKKLSAGKNGACLGHDTVNYGSIKEIYITKRLLVASRVEHWLPVQRAVRAPVIVQDCLRLISWWDLYLGPVVTSSIIIA